MIACINFRTVAEGTQLCVDGSLSYDPDDANTNLQYYWTCTSVRISKLSKVIELMLYFFDKLLIHELIILYKTVSINVTIFKSGSFSYEYSFLSAGIAEPPKALNLSFITFFTG